MDKAKVYFTKEITPESVIKMYEKIGKITRMLCKIKNLSSSLHSFLQIF